MLVYLKVELHLQVTNLRKHVMPLDGTFDFWVLLFCMSLSLFAAGMGIKVLAQRGALLEWDDGDESLRWIGVVFAIADATPGLLFLGSVPPLQRVSNCHYKTCIRSSRSVCHIMHSSSCLGGSNFFHSSLYSLFSECFCCFIGLRIAVDYMLVIE